MSHLTIEDIRAAHASRDEGGHMGCRGCEGTCCTGVGNVPCSCEPEPEPESDQPAFQRGTSSDKPTKIKPASQLSIDYMRNLISERYPDVSEEYIQSVIDQGQRRVSQAITKLKGMPLDGLYVEASDVVEVEVNRHGIPIGRYALRDDEGTVHFYSLSADGIFVQASDEFHRVSKRKTQARIIKDIQADPEAASALYGRELGVCGRCGRTLTDEDSRERGIGPVCMEKEWS